MKNHIRNKILLLVLLVTGLLIGFTACTRKTSPQKEGSIKEETQISHYTCPMHPHIHEDHPGECPICHMSLVPVYQETSPQPSPLQGEGVLISPERQQLIGIKSEPAVREKVSREIRTVGRVAFDPELAIAEREFVEIARNVPSLKAAATSRLRILGLSEEEIKGLEKKARPSLNALPQTGESVWVYATLYQEEMDLVVPGAHAEIASPSETNRNFEGKVRSIDPIVDPATRSVRARIEIPKAGGLLKPQSYVNVLLRSDLGESLTVPKSAILDSGTRKIAFVMHGNDRFETREVKTGPETQDKIIIREGVREGEKVVTSAAFLVDSESQLKAAISVSGSTPTCPEDQVWDVGMAMCMPKVGK